ncbi:MAG: hypothetical protein WD534_18855 [Phycisphaeraceae bacterium]
MSNVKHPKVVILGAGSLFFGRKAIWQMVHSPHLNTGTLALVDTDADRLAKMERLARMVAEHNNVKLTIEASTDRTDVLDDADFVVLSFADRNAHFRGVDVQTSAKYGIRMCSGDTIGPGGVMRTAREFPEIIRVCRDIEKQCADAWVVTYINPAAVNGIGVRRYFPNLKSFALCDAQWGLRNNYAKLAGVENDEKFTLLSAGPNHFTWLLKAEYDGQDVLPRIIDSVRGKADDDANQQAQGGKAHAKGYANNSIAIELYEAFGYLPTVLGHTKEYVRFYQGLGKTGRDRHEPLKLFETDARFAWTQRVWDRVDEYITGKVDIAEFDTEFGPDPATDVIENMWGKLGKRMFINTMNRGAVPNMADDAFLELYCDMSMEGPAPVPYPAMPRGVRGMCETILDTHELTAQAVYKGRRDLLRRALLVDPLTSSIGDIDALLDELLELEADALPEHRFAADTATAV